MIQDRDHILIKNNLLKFVKKVALSLKQKELVGDFYGISSEIAESDYGDTPRESNIDKPKKVVTRMPTMVKFSDTALFKVGYTKEISCQTEVALTGLDPKKDKPNHPIDLGIKKKTKAKTKRPTLNHSSDEEDPQTPSRAPKSVTSGFKPSKSSKKREKKSIGIINENI